jgi:pilus assembly protein CpaE
VVLVAPALDIDLMRSALGAGLSEVISTDEVATRLATVVDRLVARLARTMAGDTPQDEPSGEVIAVVGAKGGVGVTTVAVNLAAELAGRDRRVALIDADLQFGDVAVTMGLGRSSTLRDAVELGTRLDPFALQTMMTSHASSVLVLPGPTDPSAADLIRPVDVARVIRCAATLADIVIVDVPSGLNELGLEILDGADRIVLVLAPDVANLKNARLEIDMLAKLHLAAKTKVIVNRVGPTSHASPRRIEHHLGLHIAGQIPESAEIRVAETTSTPFVTGARRSHAAKAFRAICEDLVPSRRTADDHGRLVTSRG